MQRFRDLIFADGRCSGSAHNINVAVAPPIKFELAEKRVKNLTSTAASEQSG